MVVSEIYFDLCCIRLVAAYAEPNLKLRFFPPSWRADKGSVLLDTQVVFSRAGKRSKLLLVSKFPVDCLLPN